MMPPVTGYVLAGGESSRMQAAGLPRDKALLPLDGGTMLQRVAGTLGEACSEVTILCGTPERGQRLQFAGRTLSDAIPGCGPLGGLEAAMRDSPGDWLLLLPVDLPLLPGWALRVLIEQGIDEGEPGVACFQALDRRQPLPVLLHRAAHGVVMQALRSGERKLMPVLQRASQAICPLGMCILPAEDFAGELDVSMWFTNVNTPDDYRAAQELIAAGNGFLPRASE